MGKSDLTKLVEQIYYKAGNEAMVECLDRIKKLGFGYSTMGGISFAIGDLIIPEKKDSILKKAEKEVQKIENLYMDGIITNGERKNKVISIWSHATAEVATQMMKTLEEQDQVAYKNEDLSCQAI